MKSNAPDATLADGFTASASHGVLPLVIWAAHFFASYASVEVACALQLQHAGLIIWLWIATAIATASLVVLTMAAVRYGRADDGSGSVQASVRIGAAILALVGVLWSAVPIALLDGTTVCHLVR